MSNPNTIEDIDTPIWGAKAIAKVAGEDDPRKAFYLTGRVGETDIALHSEGSRVVLTRSDGGREEVDLEATGRRVDEGAVAALPEPVAPSAVERAAIVSDESSDTAERGQP